MKLLLILLILVSVRGNSQSSSVYISKCRMLHSLTKSICEKLTLNQDSTFEYILGYSSDLQIQRSGNCYFNGDTIITVAKNMDISVNRSRNDVDYFTIQFKGYLVYPVKIDSVRVYLNGEIINSGKNINSIQFDDADSVRYYFYGNSHKIITFPNPYKQNKKIVVSLPVDYFIRKDPNILVGYYSHWKYKRYKLP